MAQASSARGPSISMLVSMSGITPITFNDIDSGPALWNLRDSPLADYIDSERRQHYKVSRSIVCRSGGLIDHAWLGECLLSRSLYVWIEDTSTRPD